MEEALQIRRFSEVPSPEEFATQIERRNVPAVFSGCVKDWKAFSKWNVSDGGLDYLQESVGSSVVEAMLSRSAPVFYGDIRSHERVPLPFSTFIGYCKDLFQYKVDGTDSISQLRNHDPVGLVTQCGGDFAKGEESPQQIYLAQIPIVNTENEEKGQLECLRDDIEMPAFLEGKILASINLWMNNARTRSSTHYDPHHNLLCIISGCKQVVLWPPSACPFLYPLPVYGEASNHSAIPLENTNLSLYPRAKSIDEYSQKVTLYAGDAVFIPEGCLSALSQSNYAQRHQDFNKNDNCAVHMEIIDAGFHQVDSEDLTIAVNFWWRSDMMSGMIEHMDAYYLRRILKRLTDKEMDRMLSMPSTTVVNDMITASSQSGNCDEGLDYNHQKVGEKGKLEQGFSLHELEPHALRSLHELVSLVHHSINQKQPASNASADQVVSGEEDEVNKTTETNLFNLEEDPIAIIVWNLEPRAFQSVFLAMAHNFPRTLEALVLHALSPVGVEVLTRKFEQMDQIILPNERSQFYEKFYSVFDNQFSAMDALLNGKESFACREERVDCLPSKGRQFRRWSRFYSMLTESENASMGKIKAFNNVVVQYLGIDLEGPKSSHHCNRND